MFDLPRIRLCTSRADFDQSITAISLVSILARLALPVWQPEKLRDGTALAVLRELAPQLIAVVAKPVEQLPRCFIFPHRNRPGKDHVPGVHPFGHVGKRLIVGCGEGAVELVEIQPEGSRRMPAADYLRGHPVETGTRLGE